MSSSTGLCPTYPPCFCEALIGSPINIICGTSLDRQVTFPKFLNLNYHINSINLLYNNLYKLPNNAFNGVHVSNIDLQGNNFEDRIDEKSFSSVSRYLQSLNMAWSHISNLSGKTFRSMVILKNLTLAENWLVSLPNEIFQDLRSLQRLSLAGNPLKELPYDVFRYQTNLDVLDLGYCILERISWHLFSGLWNLKKLDLRGNRLRTIESHTFADLYSLETLLLGHNPLKHLNSRVFTGLSNLYTLNIEESDLEFIASDVFRDTHNLHILDLGDNNLKRLEYGMLFIPSLRSLSLDGNKLTKIPKDLIYLRWLEHLDVSYNRLRTLDRCTLENLQSLEYLNLRENPFSCTCDIFWLRRLQNMLIRKWNRQEKLPFVPGKCAGPKELKGVGITSWIDLDCLSMYYGGSQEVKCNWYW